MESQLMSYDEFCENIVTVNRTLNGLRVVELMN